MILQQDLAKALLRELTAAQRLVLTLVLNGPDLEAAREQLGGKKAHRPRMTQAGPL